MRALRLVLAAALLGLILTPTAEAAPTTSVSGGWPLAGTPRVLRGFDPPDDPWGSGHRGVDLAARPRDRVLSGTSGTVAFAGTVAGKPVVVVSYRGMRVTYEPVRASVHVGQRVSAGQLIGRLGHEDHCGDGCLHWGLKRGSTYLDPLSLLAPPRADGVLRLVPAAQRAVVEREAAARAAAAALEDAAGAATFMSTGTTGSPGNHGFSHPVPGAITSPYGMRFHPVLHVWKLHDGTDFGAACGTPIRAPYAGRVTRAYVNAGYGNRLFLDHGTVDGKRVLTAYNHATRYVVAPGQQVRRGQLIGYVGTTGFSTGCHLHLMVWLDSTMVDPMTWF